MLDKGSKRQPAKASISGRVGDALSHSWSAKISLGAQRYRWLLNTNSNDANATLFNRRRWMKGKEEDEEEEEEDQTRRREMEREIWEEENLTRGH